VFPEPFGPSRAQCSPLLIVQRTSRRMSTPSRRKEPTSTRATFVAWVIGPILPWLVGRLRARAIRVQKPPMRADEQAPGAAPAADSRKWWVLVAVGTGTFMSALDGSVVNAILPVLRDELRTDVATVEWVVTVYL